MAWVVKDLIEEALTGIKNEILAEMESGGFNASGRTANSFEINIEEYYGELTGLRSFQTLVAKRLTDGGKGRGPTVNSGDGQLYRSILQWIQDKGIEPETGTIEGMAYAITKTIHKKGTEIYRGKREGIDLKGIANKHIEELIKKYLFRITTNLKKDAANNNATA